MSPVAEPALGVAPFAIRAETCRNNDIIIKTLHRKRLRGTFKPSIKTTDGKTRGIILNQQSAPVVPGMELHINPAKLEYRVLDPLDGDEATIKQIEDFFKTAVGMPQKIRAVPVQVGTIDEDEMKTLCREVYQIIKAEEAVMVRGPRPTLEQCDALPGRYLLSPGAVVETSQPRYEEDYAAWKQKLNTFG